MRDESLGQLIETMRRIRCEAKPPSLYGNCFQLCTPAARSILTTRKSLVFLIPDSDFSRVYFLTSDLSDLPAPLCDTIRGRDVCLNYVCRGEIPEPLHKILDSIMPYSLRHERISKHSFKEIPTAPDYAIPEESDEINSLLQANFDKYDNFLPDMEELKAGIREQTVIVSRGEDGIDGLLLYSVRGKTVHSHLLYAKNNNPFVFARLHAFREYECVRRNVKSVYAWINPDLNRRLIAANLAAGFIRDNILDYYYLRRAEQRDTSCRA